MTTSTSITLVTLLHQCLRLWQPDIVTILHANPSPDDKHAMYATVLATAIGASDRQQFAVILLDGNNDQVNGTFGIEGISRSRRFFCICVVSNAPGLLWYTMVEPCWIQLQAILGVAFNEHQHVIVVDAEIKIDVTPAFLRNMFMIIPNAIVAKADREHVDTRVFKHMLMENRLQPTVTLRNAWRGLNTSTTQLFLAEMLQHQEEWMYGLLGLFESVNYCGCCLKAAIYFCLFE